MIKRLLAALTAVLFLAGGAAIVAPSAQAAFGLACNIPGTNLRPRIDTPGITRRNDGAKVDATSFTYTSRWASTGGQATWSADAVWVQLYDAVSGHWIVWTSRGGTATDSSTVPAEYQWDPSARYDEAANYTKFKYHFWAGGGSCDSGSVSF